jgi:large subunit ribosomal protein L23
MEKFMNNLGDLLNLIKYPSLTEKSVNLYGEHQYTFIVDKSLTKNKIKFVLENIFNVNVVKVNTSILPIKKRKVGKFVGKRTNYKKAYIKLKKGDRINILFN